jgi:hypothetical protein
MNKKAIPSIVILFISLGIFLGFSVIDKEPNGSRIQEPVQLESIPPSPPPYYVSPNAIIYEDSLDGANDTTDLKARGYLVYYRGSGPQGLTATWFQGNNTVFPAFNGPSTGYVAANYNVVTGMNNIDSWLVLPITSVSVGDTLSFYERSPTGSTWPDSMRIMYSPVGDSVPEAASWVELGRFKNNITAWTQRIFTVPTAGANGRFALRYNVVNGGPTGTNSNFIGVDWIRVYGTPTGVTNNQTPVAYDLSQNYPNPFNPSTTINYSIKQSGLVTLKVYDILGKKVATLVNDLKVAGSYSVTFNGSDFSSSVYTYRLEVNDFVSVKRMLLVK